MSSSVIPCSVLFLSCTGPRSVLYCILADESSLLLQSSSKPLKVAFGVPSRGHSVQQFIFSYCHANVFLVAARTKVYLAVDRQWTPIFPLGNVFIEGCSTTDRSSRSSRKSLNNPLPRN
jgi:hypothetical protein